MGSLFGGGGSTTAQPINAAKQFGQILNLVPKEISQYQGFVSGQPNLQTANQLAQFGANAQTPALQGLLTNAFGNLPSVSTYTTPVTGAFNQLAPTPGLTGPLQNALGQYNQIIQSGGALTPDQQRAGTQDVLKQLAASGMATSPVAPYLTAMNLQNLRSQRLAQATGQAQGLSQGISGLGTQGLNNAVNYANALRGFDVGNLGTTLGFGQGIQALGQTPFANLLAAQGAGTSGYGTFLGIPAQFGTDVTGFNANLAATQAFANQNKQNQALGSALGSSGSVVSGLAQSGVFG